MCQRGKWEVSLSVCDQRHGEKMEDSGISAGMGFEGQVEL